MLLDGLLSELTVTNRRWLVILSVCFALVSVSDFTFVKILFYIHNNTEIMMNNFVLQRANMSRSDDTWDLVNESNCRPSR